MSAAPSFECPNCGTPLTAGVTACGRCRIRLTGPQAVRLWEVDQQIGALNAERQVLIGALTSSGPQPATNAWAPVPHDDRQGQFTPPARLPAPAAYTPKKSVSGQQLLLGLGALLLLSAASFFLLVVWLIVGVVGQAFIMVVLTGVAVAGSVLATLRRLPAAAETAAVIATGFLYLDLSGAHARGLFGLDGLSYAGYWVGASVLGGALLVAWDRLVPRVRDGVALRRVITYRPAAAVLFAAAPWFAVASALPERAWLSAAMLVVALVNLACGLVALRLNEAPTTPATSGPAGPDALQAAARKPRLPLSAWVLFAAAALATVVHALAGLVTGYDPRLPIAERYSAFALLMLVPVALAALSTGAGSRFTARVDPARSRTFPAMAVAWAAPALGIPLLDATYPVLLALSVVAAVAASCLHLGLVRPATEAGKRWLQATSVAAYVAQPVLLAIVCLLVLTEHGTLRDLLALNTAADTVDDPSVLWMVVPAALWTLSATLGAGRRRSATWAFVAAVALLCTLVVGLSDSDAQTWMTVLLVAFAAHVALARLALRRGSYALAAPAGAGVQGDPFWAGVDRTAVFFGAAYALGALVSSLGLSPGRQSLVLVIVGVLTLVYAAGPGRLAFAYLGSLAISAGTANLVREAGVQITEAYTAPLVLLLAAIGLVQWTRDKTLPTFLTMGPALVVALGPSLLTSLGDGDELRLAVVTFAAIVILVVGLRNRWQAPVTAGGLVLVVVAITQGGPYVAYVPTWIILGAAGTALIAAGVAWEMAVVAGRRAATWYGSLR